MNVPTLSPSPRPQRSIAEITAPFQHAQSVADRVVAAGSDSAQLPNFYEVQHAVQSTRAAADELAAAFDQGTSWTGRLTTNAATLARAAADALAEVSLYMQSDAPMMDLIQRNGSVAQATVGAALLVVRDATEYQSQRN